jgi:CHAD domain-containing protein
MAVRRQIVRAELATLALKRRRKLLRAVSAVLDSDKAKPVHGARVGSRRLQEDLAVLFSKPYPKKIRRLRRKLKELRRHLGNWRNCDVVLDVMAGKLADEVTRPVWKVVEKHVKKERARAIDKARRKIDQDDLRGAKARLRKVAESKQAEVVPIAVSVGKVHEKWRSALLEAEKTRAEGDLHALRIATKKLRYRLELGRDLGLNPSPLLDPVTQLQRALGDWHDRAMLGQMIAEALARPKLVLRQQEAAETLLQELKTVKRQQSEAMEEIFRSARAAEIQSGPGRLYFLPLAPGGSASTTREIRRFRSSKTSSMLPDASTTSKP